MALLQAEALFGDRGTDLSPIMDDDFFDDHADLSTSPELERAATYYAKKKQYGKAAHAALYSGFVQQHYDEKENAMRSFKEAEQFGGLAGDSLTMALAEYRMGKTLYDDYMEKESVGLFKYANSSFGNHYNERALALNMEAVAYMVLKQFDSANFCLKKSLTYAEKSQSNKAKRKVLNNYAVFYRLQGNHVQAIESLRQIASEPDLTNTEKTLLYLNLGNSYAAFRETDSASVYYERLEESLSTTNLKDDTKVSAYGALSRFAESQGDTALALQYLKVHGNLMSGIQSNIEKKSIFRIQRQYDFESLQNEMNRKLIQRQHIITIFGIFAIIGLTALAISQIRLAKTRKQEAEAKANSFHFMQQNKELAQKHESSEKALADLSMMHKADEKAYQDLIQKNSEIESACNSYAQQLSDALNKEALTMRKLDIFLKNREEKAYLAALKDAVFNDEDPWDALMGIFDLLYPNVRTNLTMQYPELTEMEQKDFILSYFNVSRDEEARLFQKSVHYVDKLRYTVRQKMKQSVTEPAPKSIEQA
jgi:tetratricopeptide (TPR) repeat protein